MIPLLLALAIAGLMQVARSFSSDFSTGGTELAFGFLLLIAYLTSKLAGRIGLPKLTGYLIAGVLTGEYVLGLVDHEMSASLRIVSDAATAILALQAGAELQLSEIRPVFKVIRGIMLLAVLGSIITIAGALYALRPWLPAVFSGLGMAPTIAVCLAIGTALSAQSPAVVMALLSETKAEGPLSRTMLASVVVADLTVITVFSVVLAAASAVIGGHVNVPLTILEVAWELLGSVGFGVAIGSVLGRYLRSVKTSAPLFALLVCVVVAELGPRMHLDVLIVLLASGIWLRNFSKADAKPLLHKFESAQLPVFLVFFALAGGHLDISALAGGLVPIAIIAVVRAISFFLGARGACAISKADPVVARYAWFALLPQAGLALALANVLRNNFSGSFGPGAATVLLGVVGFNECIAPVVLRFVILRSGEAGKKQGEDFAASH